MDDVNTMRTMRGQTDIPMAIFSYRVPFIKGVIREDQREFIIKEDRVLLNPQKLVELSQYIHRYNEIEKAILKSSPKQKNLILKYVGKPGTLPYEYIKPKSWIRRIFNF
jgi:hypothetical protein